jgi:hypothetical protein
MPEAGHARPITQPAGSAFTPGASAKRGISGVSSYFGNGQMPLISDSAAKPHQLFEASSYLRLRE